MSDIEQQEAHRELSHVQRQEIRPGVTPASIWTSCCAGRGNVRGRGSSWIPWNLSREWVECLHCGKRSVVYVVSMRWITKCHWDLSKLSGDTSAPPLLWSADRMDFLHVCLPTYLWRCSRRYVTLYFRCVTRFMARTSFKRELLKDKNGRSSMLKLVKRSTDYLALF
jgi:hypothetical protein